MKQFLCKIKSCNGHLSEEDEEAYFPRIPVKGEKIGISGPNGGTYLVEDIKQWATSPKSIRSGCHAIVYVRWIEENKFDD